MIKGQKVLSEQDFKLLYFLWKWKMSTTAAIATAIYCSKTWYRSYVRLNELAKCKYIRAIASESGNSFIWTLDNKGYASIEEFLPTLSSTGYKSGNLGHDFLVSAVHLGEWLIKAPMGCATFSEQELRRFTHEAYPAWVPITDTHRPDGYWKIASANSNQNPSWFSQDFKEPNRDVNKEEFKVVALEVELSLKSPSEYQEVGQFYSKNYGTHQVIWITKTISSAKYILRHLSNSNEGHKSIHSFITLDQYYEHQWQSKIIEGKDRGLVMSELIGKSSEIHPLGSLGVFSLDGRKSPKISTTIEHIRKQKFGGTRGYMEHEI